MFKKITFAILAGVILTAPGDSLGQRGGGGGQRGGGGGGRGGSEASSIVVGTDAAQITLIPYPEKNWIIARAPAEVLKQIEQWIIKLDLEETVGQKYDTISVSYVDVDEVASRLNEVMSEINVEIQKNIFIQPLVESRQLLVFGKEEYRQMIKQLVSEIDLPSNQLQRQTFKIKYADPEDIKAKLDELYSMTGTSTGTTRNIRTTISRTSYGSTGASAISADTVIITTYPSLRQLVVLASPDNMEKIKTQIEEWDSPIVWEELRPRIIKVKNVDPVQMVDLLTTLFSSSGSGSSNIANTRQFLQANYGTLATDAEKIIGPLYGKLTFADIPGTKKIIVVSNIAEAYNVVESFIKEIDSEEMAVIPKVVQLKYADSEDLTRRLNTIFAEAGQSTSISMSQTGLSSTSSMGVETTTTTTAVDDYTPPWSSGGGGGAGEEMETSNVFGRVRFMPEPNTKSILVLAPEQFMDDLIALIAELDVSGKQVLIETAIVEIEHSKMSSLGLQFTSGSASDPGTYGLSSTGTFSNGPVTSSTGAISFPDLISRSDFQLSAVTANVVVDFLINQANGKILNQQTLWTKDNTEASFFKGKTIPIITGVATTTSGGVPTTIDTYDRQAVGMEVRVRPSITPENNVNMVVNVNYSQEAGRDELSGQTITSDMTTTTNMIVQNGDTLILGGILFQVDQLTRKKIPLLGDIPIVGAAFRHDDEKKSNNELLIFLTPHVIDKAPENLDALIEKTKEVINNPKTRLDQIREELDKSMKSIGVQRQSKQK